MYVILFQVQYNLVLLDMLSIIKLQFSSVQVSLTSKLCLPGGTSCSGLYGEAPPERSAFSKLAVY